MPLPSAREAPIAPVAPAGGMSKSQVFWKRLRSTLVLWALVAVAVMYKVDWPFHVLVTVLGLGSLWEYLQLDREVPRSSSGWIMGLGVCYYAGLAAHYGGLPIPLELLDGAFLLLVLTGLFVPAFFRPLEGQKTLWQIMFPAFGFFYVAYLFSFLTRILFTPWDAAVPHSGVMYALFVVLATKFTDTGAYVMGSLIGKHKMIPHISPGKTWEGLITKWCAGAQMARLGWGETFVLCLVISVVCVAGDLAESLIKRCLHTKDSGSTLPGIGGALDLTDSLLWTTPLFYLYLRHAT
jgi:phosphatidate cytidylyltransferase